MEKTNKTKPQTGQKINTQSDKKAKTISSWEYYGKTEKPHFQNYKDWVKKCLELENENNPRFYLCERCEGIYVNYLPLNDCKGKKGGRTCGNDDQEQFKEITGEMRKFLLDGGSIKKIIRGYSYTFS